MKPVLKTKAKLNKLSDICSDIAQIAAASIVVPFAIDKFNPTMVAWGVAVAITFWIFSILLAQ